MSKIQEELEKIRDQISELTQLRMAFGEVGNTVLEERLVQMSNQMYDATVAIAKEEREIGDARFREAQQSSRNVLDAVLGGVELAKRPPYPEFDNDADNVLEYCLDPGEDEDFARQLEDDGIKPLPGVDIDEWNKKLERWLELWSLPPERSSSEQDVLAGWLALNGMGHVYCAASRLSGHIGTTLPEQKEEVE